MEEEGKIISDAKENEQGLNKSYFPLDYTITDPQQRNARVHEIINNTPPEKLTPYYLEQLTKYLTEFQTEKKERKILTDNRMVTINKRETSYEGLVAKLQNGEDGIYNFTTGEGGDKNILLVPKIQITEEDINTIPELKILREQIKKVELRQSIARGKEKYLLTKQLIQMRQDQYVIKSAFKPPITVTKITKSLNYIDLSEKISVDENGDPVSDCLISLFNPEHVCSILCNYSRLKEDSWGKFEGDWWYLMQDFDQISQAALKQDYPVLYDIMIYKIDGMQNKDIAEKIKKDHDISYSVEYLSVLWRKKIPKIIADKAKQKWVLWYYTHKEKGKWKRCSRCHEIKLAHPYFYTKNKTAKDGWYSMCKCCRNKKDKKK